MRLRSALLPLAAFAFCVAVKAQSPTYGVGRTPTPEEIKAWDIAIGPEGKELPPGSGTAKQGAPIFAQKCAACHGPTGSEGPAPMLIKPQPGSKGPAGPCLNPCIRENNLMAVHSPYATTIWDYINRGMPFKQEGTLKPDEVYALTAFILYKNGVIGEDDVLDQSTLPKVKMPNANGYAIPDWKPGQPRPFSPKP
ncbi:MAG TPA: c-type cytochrome [Candidatus Acidoferrales bacterium]|jgi:cytochrome c|nr:c-type cytochrome [Candidatus Acidoferrales bacterium]